MRLNQGVAGPLPSQQQSAGLLHLEWFESVVFSPPNKKPTPKGVGFVWWRQQDSNL